MEWSNPYNSFNSMKGLTYYQHYKKIMDWWGKRGELPPPIEASLDPINACNHRCYYCNSQRYLRGHPGALQQWSSEYLEIKLYKLAECGIVAFCWGGGGEALLNKNLHGMTELGVGLGMEASIITNGALLEDYIDELLLCRWIGVSLDSADPDVYQSIRGTDDCLTVLDNVRELCKRRTKTDIAIKVLVLPETLDTLVCTCKVARDLGVQDFHVRPVDLERKDYRGRKVDFDVNKVRTILDSCHALETPDFHVYTVTHKYDENFHVKHNFNKCYASPLVTQICTDKKMYVCVDHRLEPRFEIKEWGGDAHRELLKGIDPHTECARCTWSEYNRQVEEVVINDRMCVGFP